MSVVVRVINEDIGKQLVIPYKAVTEQMGEYYVYVINADTVRQQRLALGTQVQDKIVVREGLKAGDNIVLEGIQRLRQGARVQTGNPAQPVQATTK
jgi:membrane fusion protein (multidrug efflux system)